VQTTTQNPSLARQLYSMTWPMLFGVLSLMTFQLADSAFVGQLGRDPLAALGFTLPMQQLIIGLQVGLGIATTAIVSRTLGAGDELPVRGTAFVSVRERDRPGVGAVARELRSLYAMQQDCEAGQPVGRVLSSHRVWQSRAAAVQACLQRHDSGSLGALLQQALTVDGSLKGYAEGDPWDQLDQLLLDLASGAKPLRRQQRKGRQV